MTLQRSTRYWSLYSEASSLPLNPKFRRKYATQAEVPNAKRWHTSYPEPLSWRLLIDVFSFPIQRRQSAEHTTSPTRRTAHSLHADLLPTRRAFFNSSQSQCPCASRDKPPLSARTTVGNNPSRRASIGIRPLSAVALSSDPTRHCLIGPFLGGRDISHSLQGHTAHSWTIKDWAHPPPHPVQSTKAWPAQCSPEVRVVVQVA